MWWGDEPPEPRPPTIRWDHAHFEGRKLPPSLLTREQIEQLTARWWNHCAACDALLDDR
jgi:hypothetical protein